MYCLMDKSHGVDASAGWEQLYQMVSNINSVVKILLVERLQIVCRKIHITS